MIGSDELGLRTCTEAEYHADPCKTPSLSRSIAHILVSKSPAHAALAHPRIGGDTVVSQVDPLAAAIRIGNAVDAVLLQGGLGIVVSEEEDWTDWKKQAPRDWRLSELAEGNIPLLRHEADEVDHLVDAAQEALKRAGLTLNGQSQQTIIWRDQGVLCRSRLDHLCRHDHSALIVDVKTAHSGEPTEFARSVYNHGYDIQAHAYRRAVETTWPELVGRVRFAWLVLEKGPPYAAYVASPGGDTDILGEKRWEMARELWRSCLQANSWPAYSPGFIGVPQWAIKAFLERETEHYDEALFAEDSNA